MKAAFRLILTIVLGVVLVNRATLLAQTPPDSSTLPPTISAPATGVTAGTALFVSFRLPEAAKPGTVTLTFSGSSTVTLVLSSLRETAGSHSFTFDPRNPGASSSVASGSAIPDGLYTLTLTYQDAVGNPPAVAFASALTIDTNGPTGGSFLVTARLPVRAGSTLTARFANWSDARTPLAYGVYVVEDGGREREIIAPGTSRTPTFALPQGSFTVRGRIFDSVGNSTATVDSIFDVAPLLDDTFTPQVTVSSPDDVVFGPVRIAGTVRENVGLVSFTVKVNGVVRKLDSPLAFVRNRSVRYSASGVSLQLGENLITVEAVDYAGRIGVASKKVVFATRPLPGSTYTAVLRPVAKPTFETLGRVTVTVNKNSSFTGKVSLGGIELPITGIINSLGEARFGVSRLPVVGLVSTGDYDAYLGALQFRVDEATGLVGTISTQATGGAVLANFSGARMPFNSLNRVPLTYLNLPTVGTPTRAFYTVAFPAKEQDPVRDRSTYPQGDCVASIAMSGEGLITLSLRLADGTKQIVSPRLRADGTIPVYAPLYGRAGVFVGELALENLPDTDVSGADLVWIRPALPLSRYYPQGWQSGITVDAIGAKYAKPSSADIGQGVSNPNQGNSTITFSDGVLSVPVSRSLNLNSTTAAVRAITAPGKFYQIALNATTGGFTGTFAHDGVLDSFQGVLVSKGLTRRGFGYYRSTPANVYGASGQSGKVTISAGLPVQP